MTVASGDGARHPNARAFGIAVGVAVVALVSVALVLRPPRPPSRCGPGFAAQGTRCCPQEAPGTGEHGAGEHDAEESGSGEHAAGDICKAHTPSCPPPLVPKKLGPKKLGPKQLGPKGQACDAPPERIAVGATSLTIGPADWEAQGQVAPRQVSVKPFAMDRFEVTVGRLACGVCASRFENERRAGDLARAAYGITPAEARAHCAAVGGRLPTEDEWMAATAGPAARRYPWGDTGAVCRRGAWGLESGPCGSHASGPDTVGAHPSGATPEGFEDLAGNVAEWVETPSREAPVLKGGSFRTSLATGLRTWASDAPARDAPPEPARDAPPVQPRADAGFRCAYDR